MNNWDYPCETNTLSVDPHIITGPYYCLELAEIDTRRFEPVPRTVEEWEREVDSWIRTRDDIAAL